MKTNKYLLLVIISVLILSCKQSFLEVEKKDYKKDGIYCLIRYGNEESKIVYAPFDSLDNFRDIGFHFGSYHTKIFHSNENNMLLVADIDDFYFIDSQTNKLIKKIKFPKSKTNTSNNSLYNYTNQFYKCNNEISYLLYGPTLFRINSKNLTVENLIRFSVDKDEQYIYRGVFSHDRRYLFLIIRPEAGHFPEVNFTLYKYDVIKNKLKNVLSFERNMFLSAITKDYYVVLGGKEVRKYRITDDKLVERKSINLDGFVGFEGSDKNNSIFCLNSEKIFYTLNLENFELKEYMLGIYSQYGGYHHLKDGLHSINYFDGLIKIINLETKEVKYQYPYKFYQYDIIIKESVID